jgi:AcrR family transcriptional regulator
VTESAFQRARSPERKAERREAILDAAAAIALREGIRAVSLADIAHDVAIHKSALLRYFATREEIYLELGRRSWREWADALERSLGELGPGGGGGGGSVVADGVAEQLAASFAERPLLCDLIPHAALNLERHATLDAIREYKLDSIGSVRRVAAALDGPLPQLDAGARGELVSCAALLAGSMWQIATPPPALAELYRAEPDLGHAIIDFEPLLAQRVRIVIAGLAAGG